MAATETTTRKFHFPSYLSLQGTRPPLSAEEVALIERYWRATNYLSVGQIYLLDNPLLTRSLKAEDVKPRLLGHFGTTPGLNFIYVHLNRVIKKGDLDMIYICGPGHGGPGMVANAYLESTYTEMFPSITEDEEGLRKLFKQFSFPGGIPSHAAPETPGSIHEGGELGYALSHAFGAAFDNPDLIVACVVGDGEAETGPLATSWHGTKFLNARRDGAVLPVLHLNGYKIANPAILARMSDGDLEELFHGHGYQPVFVEGGEDHAAMHQMMATALDWCVAEIKRIQAAARVPNAPSSDQTSKRWPMIVLRSPKGWTGPASVGGKKCEDFWRSHQVPIAEVRTIPANVKLLEEWMLSYGPAELFGRDGKLLPELRALAPQGNRRMSANPHANGGLLTKDLKLPDFRNYRVELSEGPGAMFAESTRIAGKFLRDVMKLNPEIFRVFGPDETASNRLTAVLEATSRTWCQEIYPEDEGLALDGRVMEILSEHTCEGWLEGYLLTGRHGWFSTYEAFAHVVDSMVNQMAKWLKVTNGIVWRRPVPSLNILLTSHVWRQDHNGFSHQDPGFVDHVVNKKGEVTRVYFPPDANCLLNTVDHVLRSRQYINVIISGKQPQLQFLDMDAAEKHATLGLSIWPWASTDTGSEPDVVMVCCGDVPTLEALAATEILRRNFSALRIRFVNVMDLMRLQPKEEHPHGLDDKSFDSIFTKDKPVVFNFHGYPWLIHRLTYRRTNHRNIHVRGYKEEGTTTTPFDMCVLNDIDRFHLVEDVIDRVPGLMAHGGALVKQQMREKIIEHKLYIRRMGEDMPEIRNWRWSFGSPASPAAK